VAVAIENNGRFLGPKDPRRLRFRFLVVMAVLFAFALLYSSGEGDPTARLIGGALMLAGITWQARETMLDPDYKSKYPFWYGRSLFTLGLLIRFAYTVTHRN
jgi:hypothetical protein